MLNWIKNLFSGAPKSSPQRNFSPGGQYSFTHGGKTVIERPVASSDFHADAFEKRLLKWLQFSLRVKPESHVGTNTMFWKFDYNGSPVELAVIGQSKNTGMTIDEQFDWLLRVEESEPLSFLPELEKHFADAKRVKRKMKHSGKTRVQFKSDELLKDSILNGR